MIVTKRLQQENSKQNMHYIYRTNCVSEEGNPGSVISASNTPRGLSNNMNLSFSNLVPVSRSLPTLVSHRHVANLANYHLPIYQCGARHWAEGEAQHNAAGRGTWITVHLANDFHLT